MNNNMSKTPRVDTERKYWNSDQRKWTYEQESVYNLAEILEMELNEAKDNLMKCGYDEINQICNQRDKAISDSKSLEYHIIQLNKIGDQLRAEVSLLTLERDEAVVSSLTAKDSVITELNSLRAELGAAKIDIAKRSGKGMDDLFRIQDLEQERDRLKERLEIETSKETCVNCGFGWNPSLVESGWCIFCIQEETREQRDELKAKLELAQKHNWNNMVCLHHSDLERAACIGNCPVCEANNADKLGDELTQSESNFNALLKTNGNTIDENAELKAENQILQEKFDEARKLLATRVEASRVDELQDVITRHQQELAEFRKNNRYQKGFGDGYESCMKGVNAKLNELPTRG